MNSDPVLPAEEVRYATLQVGDAIVRAEVVDTDSARQKGLSGRERLPEGAGMLFVFPGADTYGIWMKDMLFPIDIIWLNADLRVVHVVEEATPESYPTAFRPRLSAQYVLEVPAGFSARYGIQVGQEFVMRDEGAAPSL